jgi:hypothetical protein
MIERELFSAAVVVLRNASKFVVPIERRNRCRFNVLDCRVTMDRSRKSKGCFAKREALRLPVGPQRRRS